MSSDESKFGTKALAKGTIAFERYEILGVIAVGAQGRVYKAHDQNLNNVVALKVLADNAKSEKDLLRFQSEARLASKMNHFNIATIYDFGLSNNTPFLSMEYVDGKSLAQMLDEVGAIPMPDFCDIFLQVCDAIIRAQNNNIVHRDIKPGNIVVKTSEGGKPIVKVLDFGIAKSVENVNEAGRLTGTGNLLGSPYYMSPEQVQGQTVTTKADNYAIGATMWHCLTGEPPFMADNLMEIYLKHVHEVPDGLSSKTKVSASPTLFSLVESLLSKSPDDRPDLLEDVKPVLTAEQALSCNQDSGGQSSEGPHSESGRVPFAKRTSLWLALTLLVVVCVCITSYARSILILTKPEAAESVSTRQESEYLFSSALKQVDEKVLDSQEIRDGKLIVTNVSNGQLEAHAGNIQIRKIELSESDVTDDQLIKLSKFPRLSNVMLNFTSVRTLKNIGLSHELEWIELKGTHVNDESMKSLLPLKRLRLLKLHHCENITDAGIETLSKINGLEEVELRDVHITNRALKSLAKLPGIQCVNLVGTEVDEPAVRKFLSEKKLSKIQINQCNKITAQQALALKRDFPAVGFDDQPSTVENLKEEANEALKLGANKKALHKFKQAFALAKDYLGPDALELASMSMDIGKVCAMLHDWQGARTYLDNSARIYQKHQSYTEAKRALDAELGWLLQAKDPAVSEKYLEVSERAANLAEAALSASTESRKNPADIKDAAERLQRVGSDYRLRGESTKALRLLTRACKLKEQLWGPLHPVTAASVIELGECFRQLKDYTSALPKYNSGLTILEKWRHDRKSAEYGPELVTAYAGKAAVFQALGKPRDCLVSAKKARDLADEIGSAIPLENKASVILQYGAYLQAQGHEAESAPELRRGAQLMARAKEEEARARRERAKAK